MGTGKTSAVITYINTHPDQKFIYITPYLKEAHRIKARCPNAHFVEPSNKIRQYNFRKLEHTAALIKQGRNITSTHQLFKNYSAETLEDIKKQEYTLFIDENVDVLELLDIHPDDIQLAIDGGYLTFEDNVGVLTDKEYNGQLFSELFAILKTRKISKITDNKNNAFFYWTMPPELITAFKDVYVCTYMFKGQSLHHLFEMYHIPYEYIGIERSDDGGYRFGSYPGYTPEYVKHLKEKIHILDHEKLNDIGDDYYALSMSWFTKSGADVDQLKNNLANYYKNIRPDGGSGTRLWGTFNGEFSSLRGKGYTKSFLTFNAKATNEYRNRNCLAYAANIFQNVVEKLFYMQHGVEVSDDIYALSILVQWIWRSAIRDGEEIDLYIPSRRMRTLLQNWIDDVSTGGKLGD
jgi:hypothetical protein